MRRFLGRHVALLLETLSTAPDTGSEASLTSPPPSSRTHPLTDLMAALEDDHHSPDDQHGTAVSRALAAAVRVTDTATTSALEDAERPRCAPFLTEALLNGVLSGDAARAMGMPSASGPLFPTQNHLTSHTSPFAGSQACATRTAEAMEQLAANAIARRLGLPARFHWPREATGLTRQQRERPQPALGVHLHTWTPVMTDARGDQHVLADAMTPAATSARNQLGPGRTDGLALLQLGHGTTTEARALFAFARPASSTSPVKTHAPVPALATTAPSDDDASSGAGGGVVYTSTLEAYLCLLQTARTQALTRCVTRSGAADEQLQHTAKLVIYASDQADPQLFSVARLMGFQHVRALQTVITPQTGNYAISADALKRQVVQDLAQGLFPCLVVGVLGSRWSGAVDPLDALAAFCHKTGVWFHVDASAGGLALLGSECTASGRTTPPPYQQRSLQEEAAKVYPVFADAAALADSIFVSLQQQGGLPLSIAGGGGSAAPYAALFLARAAKVAWTLRHTLVGSARTGAGAAASATASITPINGWAFSSAATHHHTLDALHLVPSSERRGVGSSDALSLAIHLVASPPRSAACVRRQQDILAELHAQIVADGRFDAPMNGALFGLVLVRWLTRADEAVTDLAQSWAEVLCESATQDAARALPIAIGLVSLQKRLWVSVALTSAVETADDGKRLVADAMLSLRDAAARCGQS